MINKGYFILFLFLLLQGCATASGDIFPLVKNQIFGYPEPKITSNDISESKFSFMILKVGRGPYVRLILNSYKDETFEWISANNEKIYTYKGIIVKTLNFENDFEIQNYDQFNPSIKGNQSFVINFYNPKLIGANININVSPSSLTKNNEIFGLTSEYKFEKAIESIGWETKNSFWLDRDLIAVESQQYIHPFVPKIKYVIYLK